VPAAKASTGWRARARAVGGRRPSSGRGAGPRAICRAALRAFWATTRGGSEQAGTVLVALAGFGEHLAKPPRIEALEALLGRRLE
jgi:hypothetical protein